MSTRFNELRPFEAWEDAEMRSVAFGVAGFFVVGALQTVGAIPTIYRDMLAPASGMESAFLVVLTLSVAYYHKRWMLASGGAALFLILPLLINLFWVRISSRSLVYPMIVVGLLGIISVRAVHRRISGPRWKDPMDAELLSLVEYVDSNATWKDRATWLCFAAAAIVLLILLARQIL